MAQTLKRLSAKAVQNAKAMGSIPRFLPDGGGLYLQISATGTKSWMFRYSINGRERQMGLGSLEAVDLAGARHLATDCRRLRSQGIDPIEHRNEQRAAARLAAASSMTFSDCAAAYVDSEKAGWRNAKHAAQWKSTLDTYAGPVFGALPVQAVDTAMVLRVLEPIWPTKNETASRVRGRIESVLDWATARGYRKGENPARWRGHCESLLPKPSKVKKVQHHAALPYDDLPDFMTKLAEQDGIAARALEFTILTAGRTGEIIGAKPDEFDLAARTWTVPAGRMKAHREHRVPLCDRAVAICEAVKPFRAGDDDFVFPGLMYRKPLSNAAMTAVLKRMEFGEITVHGFRSTFRDWAGECTDFPREVSEAALAHIVGDQTEQAYRRGDALEKRRRLMDAWADFCAGVTSSVVVPFRTVA